MGALEEASLLPGATLAGDLAGLKPHLEEALAALGRLGRQRDLAEREDARGGARHAPGVDRTGPAVDP